MVVKNKFYCPFGIIRVYVHEKEVQPWLIP